MEQLDLLRFVLVTLGEQQIDYALVGSFASSTWGEPRMTQDIDIAIHLGEKQIDALCDAFPAPEFYVSKDAAREAVRFGSQFNVIHPTSGNKVDFMIVGKTEWARAQLARRRKAEIFPSVEAHVAAPEDVILGKLVYFREGESEKHLRDIAGVVKIQGESLDRDYIAATAESLDVLDVWRQLLKQINE